jgi:hypothetical protein
MRSRRLFQAARSSVAVVILIAIIILIGAGVAWLSPSVTAILLASVMIITVFPAVMRYRSEQTALDPLIWGSLTLGVMFFVRPLALALYEQTSYKGFAIASQFNHVLVMAIVGALALVLGYHVRLARRLGNLIPAIPNDASNTGVIILSIGVCVIAISAYIVAAMSSGISPTSVFTQGFVQNPIQSSAYLYLAPYMIVPAALLLFRTGLQLKLASVVAVSFLIAFLMVNILASAGSRFWTLLFLGSFMLYPILRFRLRVPWIVTVLLVIVALIFVTATQYRRAGAGNEPSILTSVSETTLHPTRSIEALLLGPTIEMFDADDLELQHIPQTFGYHPLSALEDLVAAPIPHQLWHSKPYNSDAVLDTYFFGQHGVTESSASVAYSVMGGFYYDSGLVGVFIGMFLIGMLFRALYEYFIANKTNDFVIIVYAMALPIIPILMRGNLADTFSRSLFIFAPVPIVAWGARRVRRYRFKNMPQQGVDSMTAAG